MAPDFMDSDREPDETDGSNELPGAPEDGPSGPVDGALDVIDRSIGMYVLRRLTGRSSTAASEADAPVVLTADQIAKRIGVASAAPAPGPGTSEPSDAPPPAPVVAGVAATTAAAAGATAGPRIPPRSQGSAAEVGPELDRLTRSPTTAVVAASRAASAPRERLVRDSGVALLALAVVGLAVAMWPQGGQTGEPTGSALSVDRAVVTPGPTDDTDAPTATAAPTGEVAVETDVPVLTPEGTAAPRDTPKPPAVVNPASRTPRPGATPTRRPTPTPTAKPTATAGSTPSPTPDPTPDPTPTPTPDPTPTPTPDPTPTPTPDPTPTPSP